MTSVEIPDPMIHKVCMKCRKWYEPTGGQSSMKSVTGLASSIARTVEAATGDPSDFKFICFSCSAKIKARKRIIWGALIAALGLVVILRFAGFIN